MGPGGSGGSGGEGGSAAPCDRIVLTEPILTLAGGNGFHQRQPALTYSSDARDRVTVVSEWFVVEGPAIPPSELRHTSFAPWGSNWPADGTIEPSYLADLDAGVSFAAAPMTNDRLALLMSDGEKVQAPNGVLFSLDFGPGTGNLPPKHPVSTEAENAWFAALSIDGGHHLVGVGLPGVPLSSVAFVLTEADDGLGIGSPIPLGCSDSPVLVDAVASDDGWLVVGATAPGYDAVPCLDPGPVGLGKQIYTAHVDARGAVAACTTIDDVQIIHGVSAAPRPNGAWATWVYGDGRIEAAAIDVDGCAAKVFTVVEEGPQASMVGAGELGGNLVVAFFLQSTLAVLVFDESGSKLFDGSIPVTDGAPDATYPHLEVLGSPEGDAFLVAWSQIEESGMRARVARFECR